MLPVVKADTPEEKELFAALSARAGAAGKTVSDAVDGLLEEMRQDGWEAACRISERFDGLPPREVPYEEWQTALDACDPRLIADMRAAAVHILDYQKKLLTESSEWQNTEGGRVGQLIRPLNRVGIYVPGGTAAYPSSVLMTAVPARAAGVSEIIMVTPPGEHLLPEVLAAALIGGVTRIFAIGGVPAIAALTMGLGPIPRCDKIVGPGNSYVQEAKRKLFGQMDIDSFAGPSEILVLCDSTANPAWIAADLLSQAEHDRLAGVILVSLDEETAHKTVREIERQLKTLPRREIAETALRNCSAVVICESREQALRIINQTAPEHLEIVTENPDRFLPDIRNAGAVFLGAFSPEPLGDYWAGPSHVLPTSGSARFFSPLSAETFLKRSSIISYSEEAFRKSYQSIARLARSEGLEAHARSAEIRFELDTP